MRNLPQNIITSLQDGSARLCHIWLLKRQDGVVFGFSDHDQDLVFFGHICRANSGLISGASHSELGLSQVPEWSVSGVISAEGIKAEDIESGLYDEAEIELYYVAWQDTNDFVHLSSGYLARLECRGGIDDDGGQFIAHIEGLSQRLERTIGRRFTHLCDAALGDDRCGVNLADAGQTTCDKSYKTCRLNFDNAINFRGFPDLPGDDFLTLYPRNGAVMNGASREQR